MLESDDILDDFHFAVMKKRELEQQNADLVAALEKITKPEGAYSADKLTHAENTIAAMVEIAQQALAKAGKDE